jgi:hypothetical protein
VERLNVVNESPIDAERGWALAVQLERTLLAARQAARTTGDPGPLPALRALAHGDPRALDPDTLNRDWGPAWQRFADVVRITHGRVPEDPRDFVAHAPLPAVDAYVDLVDGEVNPSWWSGRVFEQRRYLALRTRELSHLIDAAVSGDVAVLDWLKEVLPAANGEAIRRIRAGATTGKWSPDFYEDRGLWLLMLCLWSPASPISPNAGSFHRWAAFRRAYDLTRSRSYDAAWEQVSSFEALPRPATRLQKEVENLRAYLILVRDEDSEPIRQAMEILRGIRDYKADSANYELVRRQSKRTRNERGSFENPYLVLGVEHGAQTAVWRRAWRRARVKSGNDIDQLSHVNEAKDRITARERNGIEPMFVIPLYAETLTPYTQRAWVHLPRGPFPNSTRDSLPQAMDELRVEALLELIGTMRGRAR